MKKVTRIISLVVVWAVGVVSAQAQARYQVGDVVENFTLTDRATGQPASLADFKGSVVFLE